ncbi:MAG: hypothetical protein R2939_05725 [Kofleriaceae bacterium]
MGGDPRRALRPRLATSVTIWITSALAAAAHPSALIALGAWAAALALAGLLAVDVPARRAACAAGHVVLGVALAAGVWLPLGERLLAHGQHFSNAPRTSVALLGELVGRGFPWSSLPLVIMVGTLGLLAAVGTRRARATTLGVTGVALLLLASDVPYLVLSTPPPAPRWRGSARPG